MIVIVSLISFVFLIIEFSKSRVRFFIIFQFKTSGSVDYYNDYLFYSYPNYYRCRDGLIFLDWMLIISILVSHIRAELIDKNINFILLGIRTMVSIIFLWDKDENWKS